MLTAVVVVALLATTPDTEFVPVRDALMQNMKSFEENLVILHDLVKTKFQGDMTTPHTGLIVWSDPEPGPDSLHALMVTKVFAGEAAEISGVRIGDRITHIGARRIEHETMLVAVMLLRGPGTIELTVRRGDQELRIPIDRKPLACVQRAVDRFDPTFWVAHIETLQGLAVDIRTTAENYQDDPVALLLIAKEFEKANTQAKELLEDSQSAFGALAASECLPSTK